MDVRFQHTLLTLFEHIQQDPTVQNIPPIPLDDWQPDSPEWQLLHGFEGMAQAIQQQQQKVARHEQQQQALTQALLDGLQETRQIEEQYRTIFEACTDGLLLRALDKGHDGEIVEANPAACQMFGYSYDEMIGMQITQLVHPSSLDQGREITRAFNAGAREVYLQRLCVRKDGSLFHIEVHIIRCMYKGKPHNLSVIRDITERLEAEQQLREREQQYRTIFEACSDGLILRSLKDGSIVEANPAACHMYGYSYDEMIGLPVQRISHELSHLPIYEILEALKAGTQEAYTQGFGTRKDGSTLSMEAHVIKCTYRGEPHSLSVIRDITENIEAERQLREKEEQYRTIFETATDAIFVHTLSDARIVEANPAACSLYGYSYDEMIGMTFDKTLHPESMPQAIEAMKQLQAGKGRVREQGKSLRKDGSSFYSDASVIECMYKGEPHLISVNHDITERVEALQQLEQHVEERTQELSTLLDISQAVASTLQLKPLLGLILDQLQILMNYTGAILFSVVGDELVAVEVRGPADGIPVLMNTHYPTKTAGPLWQVFINKAPILIDNIRGTQAEASFEAMLGEGYKVIAPYVQSWVGVPLIYKEEPIGILSLASSEPGYYTERHASLAMSVANQAATAIVNARLYARAQEIAVLEERQRLARELHDSVSQALYGITLGTHTARTLLERNPSQLAEPLDYILSLSETALTEMRALIFELRPESLEIEGLVAALSKQAAVMRTRHHINITTDLCEEPDITLEMKQALYRVAQEALHNTVKHARARAVTVRLSMCEGALELEIQDDGRGFDPAISLPGHLGLHSMRERISEMGGVLVIESELEKGTRIFARVPGI